MTTPHHPAWAALLRALPAPLLAATAVAADLPFKEPRQSEAQARQQLAALAATESRDHAFSQTNAEAERIGKRVNP